LVEFDFRKTDSEEEEKGFAETLGSLEGKVEEERASGAKEEEGKEDRGRWNCTTMVVARRGGEGQQLRRQDQRWEIAVVAGFGAVGAAAACGAERAGTRRRLSPEEAELHLHRRSLRVGLGEVLTRESQDRIIEML
jgi:hypothetical protein